MGRKLDGQPRDVPAPRIGHHLVNRIEHDEQRPLARSQGQGSFEIPRCNCLVRGQLRFGAAVTPGDHLADAIQRGRQRRRP